MNCQFTLSLYSDPINSSKKRTAGVNERLGVLAEHWAPAEACYLEACSTYLRKTVPRDDILDAMVGAVMASKAGELVALPVKPSEDEEGLVMEIVYWSELPTFNRIIGCGS